MVYLRGVCNRASTQKKEMVMSHAARSNQEEVVVQDQGISAPTSREVKKKYWSKIQTLAL